MKTNGRTLFQDIKIIHERVRMINKAFGTDFRAEYNRLYNAWTMHEIAKDSGAAMTRQLGFDVGKTMEEMYAYTDGIFRTIDFLRYNPISPAL